MLQEDQSRQATCDPSVAIDEGMNQGETMVQPCRFDLWRNVLSLMFLVPGDQLVHLGVDVLVGTELENLPVSQLDVIRSHFPNSSWKLSPSVIPERIYGIVMGL